MIVGNTILVVVAVVVGLTCIADGIVIVAHMRAGEGYQPGRAVPPIRPPSYSSIRMPSPKPIPLANRRRRYVFLMGACVVLILSAWTWISAYSTTASAIATIVGMFLLVFAVIVANTGAPHDR